MNVGICMVPGTLGIPVVCRLFKMNNDVRMTVDSTLSPMSQMVRSRVVEEAC